MAINPEVLGRRSIRLQNFDYGSYGAYFVTLVTRDRKCVFGNIVDGQMRLNRWGQTASDEWKKSAEIRNEIELDVFVIMPNHVHGIIVIANASKRPTSRSPLHSGPTKRSLGSFVGGFKAAVTKRIRELRGEADTLVWQRNYFEHIIRNDESLLRLRQYILDNPVRWEFDRENPFASVPESKDSWRNRQ
jgi:REP-associated tyrosine transposase